MEKVYNKLVRDRIPEIIRHNGQHPTTAQLDEAAFHRHLRMKLLEEVNEFLADEDIGELADVLEVVEALLRERGSGWSEVFGVKEEKVRDCGAFQEKKLLVSVQE